MPDHRIHTEADLERGIDALLTADPRFVRCQVCVLVAPFDTPRFGDRPIAQCELARHGLTELGRQRRSSRVDGIVGARRHSKRGGES